MSNWTLGKETQKAAVTLSKAYLEAHGLDKAMMHDISGEAEGEEEVKA